MTAGPAGDGITRLGVIVTDRGSRYAVSGAPAASRSDVDAILAQVKQDRTYAKATHNSWAATLPQGGLKADDGETGAGSLILRMLQQAGLDAHMVIVTRWYGGKKLGGDRFRHIRDCVRVYLEQGPESPS